MTGRLPALGQLTLFGPQPVHIARLSPVTGTLACAMCRATLAVVAACDRLDGFDGCHDCPGLVEPAPPWALLAAVDGDQAAGVEVAEAA